MAGIVKRHMEKIRYACLNYKWISGTLFNPFSPKSISFIILLCLMPDDFTLANAR